MLLYRLLLKLLPADFRRRNEAEMLDLARVQIEEHAGLRRVFAFLAASADLVRTAARLRLTGALGGPPHRPGPVRRALRAVRQDVGFGLRSLATRPGFAGMTILVLALGIGAATTISTVTSETLGRPLPYDEPDRIGVFWHFLGGESGQHLPLLNPRDIWDFREWSESFQSFTYLTGRLVTVQVGEASRITDVGLVDPGFFEFFGARALLGRTLRRPDGPADDVAVLSHGFWQEEFGGDPAVIGRTIRVYEADLRIVGVLEEEFRMHLPVEAFFIGEPDVWAISPLGPEYSGSRLYTTYVGFGRLADDVGFSEAQSELDRMMARIADVEPEVAGASVTAAIRPLRQDAVRHVRPTILLLLSAAGLTLVVSCANAAGLLLGRGRARTWELSMRSALGAGRLRIFSIVMVESVLLALAGGLGGLLLSVLGLRLVDALVGDAFPMIASVGLDAGAVRFALGVSLVAALAAGTVPAVQAATRRVAAVLKGSPRTVGARMAAGRRLVGVEVALSVVLLVGAGLLVRSFMALHDVDPGYAMTDRVAMRVALSPDRWPSAAERQALVRQLASRLDAEPRISGVAATTYLPLGGRGGQSSYAYDERTRRQWESVSADWRFVTPGYFRTSGATLLAGREFSWEDVQSNRPVLIIDDQLAAEAFPGVPHADVVGRRLQTSPGESLTEANSREIVGVVRHLKLHDLAQPFLAQMYRPMRFAGWLNGSQNFAVVVHVEGASEADLGRVRDVVESLGRGIAIQDVELFSAQVARARAPTRLASVLVGIFGASALVLAFVGLYGMLALAVQSRTKEFGIRVALGQRPSSVQRLVLVRGLQLTAASALAGVGCAWLMFRALDHLLVGVSPFDPVTYGVTILVLLASALLACWVPSRRALRVDPVQALRVE